MPHAKVRTLFDSVFAPPAQPEANACGAIPALIEGVIPLPTVLGLRSRGALERLYAREHLSAREIERLIGASHAGVLRALDRFSILRNGDGRKRPGQLPFGFDYLNHQLVKNGAEQAAIRMLRQYRAGGLSLRKIAGSLNVPDGQYSRAPGGKSKRAFRVVAPQSWPCPSPQGIQTCRYSVTNGQWAIRTPGLWLRRPSLYPAELIAQRHADGGDHVQRVVAKAQETESEDHAEQNKFSAQSEVCNKS